MAGGMPQPFSWSIFLAGLIVGLAGFAQALMRNATGVNPL
jgi:hypothetical protein